jgi:hypothetical protein
MPEARHLQYYISQDTALQSKYLQIVGFCGLNAATRR